MARKYGHIQVYEKEIKECLIQRMTHREIGKALESGKEQVRGALKGFVKRLHAKDRRQCAKYRVICGATRFLQKLLR